MWTSSYLSEEMQKLFKQMIEGYWKETASTDNPKESGLYEKQSYTDYYGKTKYRWVNTNDVSPVSGKQYYLFDDTFDGDDYFNENFPKLLTKFMASGTVNTTDTGTVPAGALTATGKGTVDLSSGESLLKKKLENASEKMRAASSIYYPPAINPYGNRYYLTEMQSGLNLMFTVSNSVSTTVNGTATQGETTTTITNASARGSLVVSFSLFVEKLILVCDLMDEEPWEYDDSYFSDRMADYIHGVVYNTTIVSTKGLLEIAGSIGTGTVS